MFCWFGLWFNAGAQEPNYKLAERFMGLDTEWNIENHTLFVYPNFLPGSDKFWFDFMTDDGRLYYFVDPEKREKRLLFEPAALAEQISLITHKAYDAKNLRLNAIKFNPEETAFTFDLDGKDYEYNVRSREVRVADPEQARSRDKYDMKYSPDRNYGIYVRNHNLYMRGNPEQGIDSAEIRLTGDGELFYSYATRDSDTSSAIRRSAISNWSVNSRKIYIIRPDRRKVKDLFLVDALAARPELKTYRYEMSGDASVAQWEIQVADVQTRKLTKIQTDRWPDQSLNILYVANDGSRLYFERRKRTCDEMEVCVADTETGESKVLITEKDTPYLDDEIKRIHFLNDGKDIVFRSERSGWGHYYLYDNQGKLKNEITKGDWVAGAIAAIDTAGRTIYFYAHGKDKTIDPYLSQYCSAALDRPDVKLLTPEEAEHRVFMSKRCRYFVDNFSRVDMEPRSVLRDRHGSVVMELPRPDLRRLYAAGWRKPERFKVKAADGITDLYGVMYKPVNFDSTRSYPVISAVYPGPFSESVTKDFALDDYYECNNRLAQVGFIVIAVGHRGGSPLRGKFYHTYGYGNMRGYPLADDKYAIEQLADRHPFINLDKVGIFGHSGGGFMSAAALLTYPDFYTAAVSSAGNHDNSIYFRSWGEQNYGVKEVKKTVKDSVNGDKEKSSFEFKVASNMELASRLKGHLLLVTGDMDDNVPPANTLRLVNALIEAGKNFDLLVLPGQDHHYGREAKEYYQRRMWRHFAKYLLENKAEN